MKLASGLLDGSEISLASGFFFLPLSQQVVLGLFDRFLISTCLFPSSVHNHHLPILVCCDVWGLWPWDSHDPLCCLDGGPGEPHFVTEER